MLSVTPHEYQMSCHTGMPEQLITRNVRKGLFTFVFHFFSSLWLITFHWHPPANGIDPQSFSQAVQLIPHTDRVAADVRPNQEGEFQSALDPELMFNHFILSQAMNWLHPSCQPDAIVLPECSLCCRVSKKPSTHSGNKEKKSKGLCSITVLLFLTHCSQRTFIYFYTDLLSRWLSSPIRNKSTSRNGLFYTMLYKCTALFRCHMMVHDNQVLLMNLFFCFEMSHF